MLFYRQRWEVKALWAKLHMLTKVPPFTHFTHWWSHDQSYFHRSSGLHWWVCIIPAWSFDVNLIAIIGQMLIKFLYIAFKHVLISWFAWVLFSSFIPSLIQLIIASLQGRGSEDRLRCIACKATVSRLSVCLWGDKCEHWVGELNLTLPVISCFEKCRLWASKQTHFRSSGKTDLSGADL